MSICRCSFQVLSRFINPDAKENLWKTVEAVANKKSVMVSFPVKSYSFHQFDNTGSSQLETESLTGLMRSTVRVSDDVSPVYSLRRDLANRVVFMATFWGKCSCVPSCLRLHVLSCTL